MKKMIALILIALMSLAGVTALAEGTSINCLINEGSYVIQIDDPEGNLGWVAASEDESIVNLYDADLIEDTFVARFDPVADGEATVSMKHYTGIACDEMHTFDLVIKDGAVTESAGGSYTASPDPIEQDPYLIGGWDAQDGGVMVITKNPGGRAWDVEITSPLTHGAYTFMTTIYYDCDLDAFVYDKGKFWEVPITEDVNDELGEAKIDGTVGTFTFTGDPENLILTWKDDQHPDEAVDFLRQPSDYTYYPEMEAYVGKWESGDYTLEIVHSDDDYNVMNCIVTQYTGEREGVRWIYDSCSYDDVGKSLTSFQIGMKFTFVNDENDDLVDNNDIYTDGAAAFKLNDDGTLTWTDFKAASSEDEMVFRKAAAIDYGMSEIYTQSDMDEAIALINAEFSTWTGCEMHSLRYAGDECVTAENLAWMKEIGEKEYAQVMEFLSDFHSPVEGGSAWEADTEYKDWQWWLTRTEDGNWELLTWGY